MSPLVAGATMSPTEKCTSGVGLGGQSPTMTGCKMRRNVGLLCTPGGGVLHQIKTRIAASWARTPLGTR
jgi:hypothetical protein